MPTFKPLIYQLPLQQINQEENDIRQHKLESIYGGKIAEYTRIEDFELCKEQILKLLGYIAALNPETLYIFSDYKDRIQYGLLLPEVANQIPEKDIKITLCAAKKSIEASLLAIENNHSKIDPGALTHYTVTECFPGAFSNIENALSHFHNNNFSLLISAAKKQLLLDLIINCYHLEDHINEIYPGDEIHWGNGIHNKIAEQYGSALIEDPRISQNIGEDTVEQYLDYIKEEFTITKLIEKLISLLPSLPNVKIDEKTFKSEYPKIESFFDSINLDIEKNSNLYMADGDDGSIIPKPNFSIYLECIIAAALEKHGYIEGTHLIIKDSRLFNNGSTIVCYDEDNEFQKLTDEEILQFLKENTLNGKIKYQLTQQLSPNTLYDLFTKTSNQPDKNNYFYRLLEKNTLPEDVISGLLDEFFSGTINSSNIFLEHQGMFARYLFERSYPLSRFRIQQLAQSLTSEEKSRYFSLAISNENVDYSKVLYYHVSDFNKKLMCARAAFHSKLKAIEIFSELGFNLNDVIEQESGNSLAHLAVIENNIPLLQTIQKLGVNLDATNNKGYTPAHLAVIHKKEKIIEILYNFDKNLLNIINDNGQTIAHLAAAIGHTETIQLLHKYQIALDTQDKDGITPAHLATKNGHEHILNQLHALDVNLTLMDNNENTIAHIAAQQNNLPLLEKIKLLGVNIDTKNKQGITPGGTFWNIISRQSYETKMQLFKFFTQFSINLKEIYNITTGDTLAHFVVNLNITEKPEYASEQIRLLQHLYDAGVNLGQKNFKGQTPVHFAAGAGNLEMIEQLHQYKIALDTQDNNGMTPAYFAVKYGHAPILKKLHALNANITTVDNEKNTIAHVAAQRVNFALLNDIKNLGIDINEKNESGMTPGAVIWNLLDNQPDKNKIQLFKFFKKLSINFNDIYHTKTGNSLAHFVVTLTGFENTLCEKLQSQLIQIIKNEGVDLNHKNNKGKTAAHMAAKAGNVHVLQELHKNGANLNTPDNEGNTIAHIATKRYSPNLILPMHNLGVNFNFPNLRNITPIYLAAFYGRINTLMSLYTILNDHPELNLDWKKILSIPYRDNHKFTFAHLAARENDCAFLKLLDLNKISREEKDNEGKITHIPIFEEKDSLGRTSIFSAIYQNRKEAFNTLIEIGADLEARDCNGNTLAHIICKKDGLNCDERLEWLSLLAEKGAKLDSVNKDNKKPIDLIRGKKVKQKISKKIDELIKAQATRMPQPREVNDTVISTNADLPTLGKRTAPEMLPMYNQVLSRQRIDLQNEEPADQISPPANKRRYG